LSVRAGGPSGAVLLDALGTLLELLPPAPALREELGRRGIALGQDAAERAIAAEISYYRAHLDEGRDAASLDRLRHRCAEVLTQALRGERNVELPEVPEMTEILLASLRFSRFADVEATLGECKRRNLALVVVSNWDVSLHAVLDRLELAGLLDGVVTSAEAGARKPAPAIFEEALTVAGVGAQNAWHVGDSVEEDVAGALRAGIRPILICRGQAPVPGEVPVISTLAELPRLLIQPPD
jgi:putative hydrolase of the HAD superfamily